jgi:hypothetical protein
MMKTSTRVLSAASLLCASVAAHAVDDSYAFASISGVQHAMDSTTTTTITGVLVNDSTPTSLSLPANVGVVGDRCAKYYDVMLEQPGVYALSVTVRTTTTPMTTTVVLANCTLTRNP